jgi:hypothetical protein
MNEIDIHAVLKWVLIVLAAGFIGQFGKTLAQYVMRKTREKAAKRQALSERPVGDPMEPLPGESSGAGNAVRGQVPADAPVAVTNGKADKKAAKARKKELKFLKKMFK